MRAGLEFSEGGRARRAGGRCLLLAVALLALILVPAAQAAPTTITEISVDRGHPSSIEGLLVDAAGNVWFSDHWWPEGAYHAVIGRLGVGGEVDEFDQGLSKYSSPSELVAGPDGNVWFADGGSGLGGAAIGRVTPAGSIDTFAAGLGGSRPGSIVLGGDGNLWFAALEDPGAIGFATPAGAIHALHLPGSVWDLVEGPDRNMWFTYRGADPAIGRVEMHEDGSSLITLFHTGLAADSRPFEIISANGHLWFSDTKDTPAIGRVSTSGEIAEFSGDLGPKSAIWDIAAANDGDVWFTDRGLGAVGRVTREGQMTEFDQEGLWEARHITAGADGNMWFTYGDAIGKITPSGAITMLRQGIGPGAYPTEIVSGPSGELWFIVNAFDRPASLGRIVPGDDGPPPAPGAPDRPGSQIFPFGNLAFQSDSGKVRVPRNWRAPLAVTCQGPVACVGSVQLTVFRPGWRAGRVVGVETFSAAAGGTVTARPKLRLTARELLRETGRLRVRLSFRSESGFMPFSASVVLVR